MSLAEGVSARVAYKALSSGNITANALANPSTAPGASGGQILRRVSSTLTLEKNTYQSAEIRSDRQIVDFRHGTQRASGKVAGEFSGATYFDFFEAVNRDTRAAGPALDQTDLGTIACSSAGTVTVTSGDPVALGLAVGMVINMTGNTTSLGNDNVNFIITGFSTSNNRVIAVTPDPVNSTASSTFTVTVPGHTTIVPSVSFTKRLFGLEVFHEDLNVSRLYNECRIGAWSTRLPATGMATIDFDVMGRSEVDNPSGPYFTSPAAATTTGVFAAVNGMLLIGGVQVGVVTSVDMAMNLKPEAADVIGQNFPAEIFLGRNDLTGTMTAFLQDNTLIDDFINESELQLLLYLTSNSTAQTPFVTMFLPRLKLSSAAVNLTGEAGQSISAGFQALKYNGTAPGVTATTFQIQDSQVS